MKKENLLKDKLAGRLAKYSAAAGAVIAIGSNADAQIAYSGAQDIQLNMWDNYNLDLDGDLTNDFEFSLSSNSTIRSSTSYGYRLFINYAMINPLGSNSILGSGWYGDALSNNAVISASQSWTNNGSRLGVVYGASYWSTGGASSSSIINSEGYFPGEGNKYVGVRFEINPGEFHYGWIQVNLNETSDELTILDWAYETTQNVQILAGDKGAPTAVINSSSTEPVNGEFGITITFSETTTGLTEGEIVVTNGTIKAGTLATSNGGLTYTATITPTATGDVTIALPADVAQDDDDNGNLAATDLVVEADLTAPTVALSTSETEPVSAAFDITITFSEVVTGLTDTEISVTNGTLSALATSDGGITYTATVTPTATGNITIALPAGVAQDAAGNDNEAATNLVVTADLTSSIATLEAESSILAFPNPTKGSMKIDLNKTALKVNSVIITNLSGNVIHQQEVTSKLIDMDLSSYKKGVYVVIMQTDNERITKRIVID